MKSIVQQPDKAPSTLAVVGRYIFTPAIMTGNHANVVGNEIQLTEAMLRCWEKDVYLCEFQGRRYGIVETHNGADGMKKMKSIVEKPAPDKAPVDPGQTVVGRSMLMLHAGESCGYWKPRPYWGAGNEVQLTDAIAMPVVCCWEKKTRLPV